MSSTISSNALSQLTIYGSDTSDDEVAGPRVSTKRTRKDSGDIPSKRLPLPDLSLNTAIPDHVDDPSLHDGRIRSFSHERGNWATFIYIPFVEREGVDELILAIMQAVPKHIDLRKTGEFHISLTKTVILKHHWIESFVDSVKNRICFKKTQYLNIRKPSIGMDMENFTSVVERKSYETQKILFMILFNDLKVYCNEERTRTFIGLCIRTGYDSLISLVKVMDECLAEFNLPLFYDKPSFHMSIAWCVGDYEDELNSILPQLNHKLQELMETCCQNNWYIFVDFLLCKTGNKYFKFYLS